MPNEVSQEEQISAAMEQMQNLIKNEGKNGTNATFLKDKIRTEGVSVAFRASDEFAVPSQNQAHNARIAPHELSKPAPDAAIQQAAVIQPAIQPVRHTGLTP